LAEFGVLGVLRPSLRGVWFGGVLLGALGSLIVMVFVEVPGKGGVILPLRTGYAATSTPGLPIVTLILDLLRLVSSNSST